MKGFLLEECYEVLEVMDGADAAVHCEELGDLLFQVVFQAQLRQEDGSFELADVVEGIADKLERRHPHVFGDEQPTDEAAIHRRWEELKREEGKGKGTLDDVPRALPALSRAAKIGTRAARVGFDWHDVSGPLEKVAEELGELRDALAEQDTDAVAAELGDLLLAVTNVARHVDVDPELALTGATDRFVERFRLVEAALASEGRAAADADLAELDRLWEGAKAALRG